MGLCRYISRTGKIGLRHDLSGEDCDGKTIQPTIQVSIVGIVK